VLGEDHPDNATTYNNIGAVLYEKGDYDGAMVMYQKALAIQAVVLGDNPSTAPTYHNIGQVLDKKKTMMVPWPCTIKRWHSKQLCLVITLTLPPPTTALEVYWILRETMMVPLAMYQKALAIQEIVLGDHPDTAITYHNI
jgi:tetratricopeptide (TPR) repeat protein